MTENVLPTLLSEYCLLAQKLQQISSLIKIYGGSLPALLKNDLPLTASTVEEPTPQTNIQPIPTIERSVEVYPLLGSWRNKILYGMKYIGKSVTSKELAELILKLENSDNAKYIDSSVSQYLSILSKKGIIHADKSEFPHRYSLIS